LYCGYDHGVGIVVVDDSCFCAWVKVKVVGVGVSIGSRVSRLYISKYFGLTRSAHCHNSMVYKKPKQDAEDE
jgi:hypothetical protein